MTISLKVLWAEGLTLDAQHFQQLDLYHESRLRHIAAAISPFAWGVQLARWSIEGVGSNSLYAKALTLIFKDGEIYQAPLSDELPLAIDLSKLPSDEQSFVFYAALPVVKAHGGNLSNGLAQRDDTRYVPFVAETPDLYTDALNSNVSYMRKTLRLFSHLDVRDAYDCIPVVKVRRKADSTFEIDPTFMAPSLSIDADPAMQNMLRGLLGKLAAKAEALYRLQRQPRGHAVEAHSGDVSSFWMLNTVSAANASLAHSAKSGHCHPEYLFEKLTVLAGGLMAFSRKYVVADLPGYDHDNPAPGFDALDAIIRELLDTVMSSRYVVIPLTVDKERGQYHHGKIDSALMDRKAGLYLAVSANMPALNLVSEVPRQLKVASPNDIDALIRSALPGLQLVHLAQVPMEVPVRPNAYYFAIDSRGELYEALTKTQAIAIFAPSTIPELRLELFAITN
ncbi:type VI secretion system protein ImpJ [Duganella sp. CF517]|uniref:type VI secretion system baseplate subunit TssK n=1 Tax=Duganella sp. CF517 TaxID=1881038 RepID=UPI0008AF0CD3|nr:type VI secretion system baseplate subunit TssK [Duganella sp. CF517]SEN09693.1 type VI secretion system protein ImpJ [Duganella sp. CF517]